MSNKKETIWVKTCPECESSQYYCNQYKLKRAVESNSRCKRCSLTGRVFTKEAIKNMSIAQQKMTPETKLKISKGLMGHVVTPATRMKISRSHTGKTMSIEHRVKLSKAIKGRILTTDHKQKIRRSYVAYLKQCFGKVGFVPTYNKQSIPIIEAKAIELGITDLQHAENGGEFHIEELGFWVDGYSKEKNIVIEYDERRHFRNGKLKKKCINRQKEIEDHLKCKFIRISQK